MSRNTCPKCSKSVEVPEEAIDGQIWCCENCGASLILDGNKLGNVIFGE